MFRQALIKIASCYTGIRGQVVDDGLVSYYIVVDEGSPGFKGREKIGGWTANNGDTGQGVNDWPNGLSITV